MYKSATAPSTLKDPQSIQRITVEWEVQKGRTAGQRGNEGETVYINVCGLFWEENLLYSFEQKCDVVWFKF